MHRERVERLLEHLENIPASKFDYSTYFENDATGIDYDQWTADGCGTTACVAGHCIMLFWALAANLREKFKDMPFGESGHCSARNIAQEILGLSRMDSHNLFVRESLSASLGDACDRLRTLLEDGNLDQYPWIE